MRRKRDLLETIPGIGEATSAQLLTWLAEPEKFSCAKAAAAFAGLTPKVRESGSSVRGRSSLSKMGDARLRKALYMPAVVAMRYNPLMKAFAQRLHERGKPNMLILGALMRKLVQIAYAILKSGKPFSTHHTLAP